MSLSVPEICPCQSGKAYTDCCQRYHSNGIGEESTAEGLMRSRYSAFSLGLVNYLMQTMHREHPQVQKNTKRWKIDLVMYCKQTAFLGLEILETQTLSATEATVTFRAQMRREGKTFFLLECSRFVRLGARWVYHSELPIKQ
jgi:SEC-C motif domain protein